MGVAEIIPGVSGGTLAFITGIYNELINSIKSINFESVSFLVKLDLRKFWKHINGNFLFTLLLGMVSSICLLYTSPSPRDGRLSRMPSSA